MKNLKHQTAKLEKTIASEIVNNEVNIENDVNKKLNSIIEHQIQAIQKQKRIVAKCHAENEAAKQKHQVSADDK
jgi:glucose-6-phosphate-specific signal transduction histidine kinase